MHHLDKVHLFDEVNHLIQARIDMSPVIPDRTESDLRPLPKIIIADLRDSHIKPMFYPIDQFPEHMSFFF
jgi:hypothetical protein